MSGDNFKTTGTLTKLLQSGVQVEEDDFEFEIEPRGKGEVEFHFDKNNLEVDDNGNFINP